MPNTNDRPVRYAERGPDGQFLPPFPFDPVWLTEATRRTVCKVVDGVPHRKYTEFYAVGVYGGIATACSVGCNFRCIFCWVDWSRDWPERYGQFYSPAEVYSKLRNIMTETGFRRARVSGAESTLCPDHLCEILELVHRDADAFDLFVIETNGVVLAIEDGLATRFAGYASRNGDTVGHVRLSIRGGLPETFTEKTGALSESLELPFKAAERLWNAGTSFHVAVVVDPRFTSDEEKRTIFDRLKDIDPSVRRGVEEEYLDPYPHALVRLRAVGREDVSGPEVSEKEHRALGRKPCS
ncbi:MAG: radical SAM protein [Candidatus Thorarchaeota archaeon]|nr:MAG: radical SAM protein [Candidatus Thorarchaeota archaeon]